MLIADDLNVGIDEYVEISKQKNIERYINRMEKYQYRYKWREIINIFGKM